MEPVEPVSLIGFSPPLQTVSPEVLFTAAVPATAFELTAIANTLLVDDGHGLLDNTALYAVDAVKAPVDNVAVVPVAVDQVGDADE